MVGKKNPVSDNITDFHVIFWTSEPSLPSSSSCFLTSSESSSLSSSLSSSDSGSDSGSGNGVFLELLESPLFFPLPVLGRAMVDCCVSCFFLCFLFCDVGRCVEYYGNSAQKTAQSTQNRAPFLGLPVS